MSDKTLITTDPSYTVSLKQGSKNNFYWQNSNMKKSQMFTSEDEAIKALKSGSITWT